jgi:hypothetical protein
MAKMETVAELVAFRQLEEVEGGNPRNQRQPMFRPGQHKARLTPAGMVQLTYVDSAGTMVMLVLQKDGDEWALAMTHGLRVSHIHMELVHIPRGFRLSDEMARAIQEAEAARDAKLEAKKAKKQQKAKTEKPQEQK